ncbi:hypothetical protein BpHYR1_053459 [Brachionus plicatilis]|uniref:Uncharacterized protein n=1 Tax=Brachionus plicatilis TaxID=10195 RepID=A0A3M7QR25_BRAPC|nr:hypothetical protein BpHYR1_053459 [Brachionus plicatilis]
MTKANFWNSEKFLPKTKKNSKIPKHFFPNLKLNTNYTNSNFRYSERTETRDLPLSSVDLPPDKAPKGKVPVGVRPLRVSTLSLSSLNTVNNLAILPMALTLLRIISFLAATDSPSSSTSSCSEQMFNMLTSISVTFSPTNGSDQVKTSIKLGNQ